MFLQIIWICATIGTVYSRGPHHPRGEAVARHHVHYRPTKGTEDTNMMQDKELIHDQEHLQEHLESVVEKPDLSNLTNEEIEFIYFQVHDVDKNLKLDGLEMLQALQHTEHDDDDHEHEDDYGVVPADRFNYFVELIDKVLDEDDVDHDGYISYPEFVEARKREPDTSLQPSVQMIK